MVLRRPVVLGQEELDFNAVQRGDAEMQQKATPVAGRCAPSRAEVSGRAPRAEGGITGRMKGGVEGRRGHEGDCRAGAGFGQNHGHVGGQRSLLEGLSFHLIQRACHLLPFECVHLHIFSVSARFYRQNRKAPGLKKAPKRNRSRNASAP